MGGGRIGSSSCGGCRWDEQAAVPDHPEPSPAILPQADDPIHRGAPGRPGRFGPVAIALAPDGRTAPRHDHTWVTAPLPPSIRGALADVVELLHRRRRPAPSLLRHRRRQPHRPEHPRDRRRVVARRQARDALRTPRAYQNLDPPRPLQQLRPRIPPTATTSPATTMRNPQPCTHPLLRLLPTQTRGLDRLDRFGHCRPLARSCVLALAAATTSPAPANHAGSEPKGRPGGGRWRQRAARNRAIACCTGWPAADQRSTWPSPCTMQRSLCTAADAANSASTACGPTL